MEPQTHISGKKIVIVEDNSALAEIYKTRLELLGHTCFIGYNGITGLYFIQNELPDLVLLDLMVPDIAGDQILLRMRASTWGKDIPVIIISNLNESEAPAGLRDLGILEYVVKANMSSDAIDQIVTEAFEATSVRPAPTESIEAVATSAPLDTVTARVDVQVPPTESDPPQDATA